MSRLSSSMLPKTRTDRCTRVWAMPYGAGVRRPALHVTNRVEGSLCLNSVHFIECRQQTVKPPINSPPRTSSLVSSVPSAAVLKPTPPSTHHPDAKALLSHALPQLYNAVGESSLALSDNGAWFQQPFAWLAMKDFVPCRTLIQTWEQLVGTGLALDDTVRGSHLRRSTQLGCSACVPE
jgi:hypothetical protein